MNNWSEVLWREYRACDDKDYARHLRRALWAAPWSWIYGFRFKQRVRPAAAEIEVAFQAACAAQGAIRYLWAPRLARLEEAQHKKSPLPRLIADLQANHWFERFIARHVLAYRGGEAVPLLLDLIQTGSPQEQDLALWLLHSLSQETTSRLAGEAARLFCDRCVVRCHHHEVEVSGAGRIDYYGCRACHQSRTFEVWPGGVVAVLDRNSRKERVEDKGQVRVNWLAERRLFDFDRVEIVQATDEEVERFAVQVGNDTDNLRKPAYKKIPCTVEPACRLSENTLRILEYTFEANGNIRIE